MGCGSGLLGTSFYDGDHGGDSLLDGDRASANTRQLPVATYLKENAERGDVAAQRARFNTDVAGAYRISGEAAVSERPDDMQVLKQLFKQLDPVVMRWTSKAQGEVMLAMRHQSAASDTGGFSKDQLLVHIVKARNLAAMDLRNNSSDPYISIELLPRKDTPAVIQSRVVHETLNPVFNEYLTLELNGDELEGSFLWLRAWDHDVLSDDDPMGYVIIPLADKLADLTSSTPTPFWYRLQPEMDDPITGSLQVTLDWQPPVQLDCIVHSAKNLLLCRQAKTSDDERQRVHYVAVAHLSHEEQVRISEAVVSDTSPEFGTLFSFHLHVGDIELRLLHIRIMALVVEDDLPKSLPNQRTDDSDEEEEEYDGSNIENIVDAEDVVYSGTMAGECYIELKHIAELTGTELNLPMQDQRGDDIRNVKAKVSARSQELQQSLQAHAQYGYPRLLFSNEEAQRTKVVQLQSTATRKSALMHLQDGVPVLS